MANVKISQIATEATSIAAADWLAMDTAAGNTRKIQFANIIKNLQPGADFTLTQNSVAVITSVNAGAVANTLYLSTGRVGINTPPDASTKLHVAGGDSDVPIVIERTAGFTGKFSLQVGSANNRLLLVDRSGTPTTLLAVEKTITADDTALLLYDTTAATTVRVTRGAADSGGAGFRLLRIPN